MKFRFNHGDLQRSPWFGLLLLPQQRRAVHAVDPGICVRSSRYTDLYVNLFLASQATIDLEGNQVEVDPADRVPVAGQRSALPCDRRSPPPADS
jgi:uncharacterized protein